MTVVFLEVEVKCSVANNSSESNFAHAGAGIVQFFPPAPRVKNVVTMSRSSEPHNEHSFGVVLRTACQEIEMYPEENRRPWSL
jgi:hypothetical protein